MKNAPSITISLFIGLILGALGFFFGTKYLTQAEYQTIIASNPSVLFDECENLPHEIQENCANTILMRHAIQQNDTSLCQNISAESQKASCLATISYIESFDTLSEEFCSTSTNRALCSELMQFLVADAQQDATLCTLIGSEGLRTECAQRLPVRVEQQAVSQEDLDGLFGPICPSTNESCKTMALATNQAIISGDRQSCLQVGIFKDLCLIEQELYTLYTSSSVEACADLPENPPNITDPESLESRLTKGSCTTQLVTAQALDSTNPEICQNLVDESLVNGCILTLERAKQGRFDYLTQ